MDSLSTFGQTLSVWLIPVILAITLHEAAHGWVAEKLGDDTARRLGRVTANPIRHIDPFGTLLLPGILVLSGAPFLFGWAKPVPVAFHRLRKPKRDMMWVALAGPGVNLLMALAAGLLLHPAGLVPDRLGDWLTNNLVNAIQANVVLAVFNMIPILPLDGGRVLTSLLPTPLAVRFARTERYGLLVMIGLLLLLPMVTRELGAPFNPIGMVIGPVMDWLIRLVFSVTGWNLG